MFMEARRECLKEMNERVCTKDGVEVTDIAWFFYGDGPAPQLILKLVTSKEVHTTGPGCEADNGCFSDIAYSYRAPILTLKERQEFILHGEAWKRISINHVGGSSNVLLSAIPYKYIVSDYIHTS